MVNNMGFFDFFSPSIESFFPVTLVIKAVIIIFILLFTILGAYIIPRGKLYVIIGGIIAILLIWYIDLEIHI